MTGSELDAKITSLQSKVQGSIFGSSKRDGIFWRGVWDLIREVSRDFRTTRYETGNEHRAAWTRFQSIVSEVKDQAERARRSQGNREEKSRKLLADIISATQAAWPREDGFMQFLGVLIGAHLMADLVIKTVELMVDVMTLGLLRPHEEKDEKKTKLLACNNRIQYAWGLYRESKVHMLPHDRDSAKKVLTAVSGEINNEWEVWKNEKQRQHEARGQRFGENKAAKARIIREARSLIGSTDKDAHHQAQKLFQEWKSVGFAGNEANESLWKEFRGALDDFYSQRKSEHRERLLAQIEKLENTIERLKENREANEQKLAEAWSDSYRELVQGWIDDGDAQIEKIEGWIGEHRRKVDQLDD